MSAYFEQRHELEQKLASRAEELLTSWLGTGRAVVRVTVDLNAKEIKERRETYDKEGVVAKKETTETTNSSSAGASKGAAPGTASVLGKGIGGGSGSESGSRLKTDKTTIDYEVPKTTQEWQNRFATIERLTVAAVVDTTGLNADEKISVEELQRMIKEAVGFKAERGDGVAVRLAKLPTANTEGFEAEWAAHQKMQDILTIVRNVSLAMVALCGVGVFVVVLRRRAAHAAAMAAADAAREEANAAVRATQNNKPAADLQRFTEEINRDPEALARALAVWLERADVEERQAA